MTERLGGGLVLPPNPTLSHEENSLVIQVQFLGLAPETWRNHRVAVIGLVWKYFNCATRIDT